MANYVPAFYSSPLAGLLDIGINLNYTTTTEIHGFFDVRKISTIQSLR